MRIHAFITLLLHQPAIHLLCWRLAGIVQWEHVDISVPLSAAEFQNTLNHYPIVVINFYAPWCHWCQRLEPTWEAATKAVHDKYPDVSDGRIRFAKVMTESLMVFCSKHSVWICMVGVQPLFACHAVCGCISTQETKGSGVEHRHARAYCSYTVATFLHWCVFAKLSCLSAYV